MVNTAFIDDMSARRTCARQHMIRWSQSGDGHSLQQKLVQLLNEALAMQLIRVLRYKAHDDPPARRKGEVIKLMDGGQRERMERAQAQADRLANRIAQLGGHADFNPQCLAQRVYSDYINCGSLPDLWREDLIAQKIIADVYREIIRLVGAQDVDTRQLLQEILNLETQYADTLADKVAALRSSRSFTLPTSATSDCRAAV